MSARSDRTTITNDESNSHSIPRAQAPMRGFIKHAAIFLLIGLALYLGIYVVAEQLVSRTTIRNRFFNIKTASSAQYDYVILGASHSAAMDYEDMTAQLQQMTGKKIINLSAVGSGITINRLFLDYFLAAHQTKAVVYVVDSFAFYSRQWNEDRFNDTALYNRAPFDPALASILIQNPATQSITLDYILGFSKINNADRFKADIGDDEATKFNKTYRPVAQIDQQRLEYLYPKEIDSTVFQHYMGEFENMLRFLQQQNIRVIVIKPPVPARFYKMLPDEAKFDETLNSMLARYKVEFHDFSLVGNDEKYFFNTDHLNKTGVLNFFNNSFKGVLTQ